MAWYDYVPVVGSIKRLSEGDYKGAAINQFSAGSPLGELSRWGSGNAAGAMGGKGDSDIRREGYDAAIESLKTLADQQKAFQMEGLDKALGFYGPARDRMTSIYGPPGAFRK